MSVCTHAVEGRYMLMFALFEGKPSCSFAPDVFDHLLEETCCVYNITLTEINLRILLQV